MRCSRCGERAVRFLWFTAERPGGEGPQRCLNCGMLGRTSWWTAAAVFLVMNAAIVLAAFGPQALGLRLLGWFVPAGIVAIVVPMLAVVVAVWWFGRFEAGSTDVDGEH